MKNLYTPTRSRIDNFEKRNLNFIEIAPHNYLKEYIYSYWQLTGYKDITPFFINYIPNGCVDIMFNKVQSDFVYIYGASKKVNEKVTQTPDIFGVRFLPGQINRFFNLPFEEIYMNPIRFNRISDKEFIYIENKLLNSNSFIERINIIDIYLKKKLNENEHNINTNLQNGLHAIFKNNGNIRIEDISKDLNLSTRSIRKIFKTHLGLSPKKLINIIRFQNVYKELIIKPKEAYDILIDSGYYDQAHFIKDFKTFTGLPPIKYLQHFLM